VMDERHLNGLQAVAGLGANDKIGLVLEHQTQALTHDSVIVGEQDVGLQRNHVRSPSSGISRYTSVPARGALVIFRVPLARLARSRMPRIPPPSRCPSRIPCPSSRTLSTTRSSLACRAMLMLAAWA